MAEFLTMSEAEDKFGSKGKTNAALTLGIIGTGLAALSNNGGCGFKFTDKDVDELVNTFKANKKAN